MRPFVEIKDLTIRFPEGNSSFEAVKHVSFQIREGEILGVVGESGSGKSTIARTVLGINRDYTGEIMLKDQHPQMVFQDPFGSLNPAKPHIRL